MSAKVHYYALSSLLEALPIRSSRKSSVRPPRAVRRVVLAGAVVVTLAACNATGGGVGFVATGAPWPLPPPGSLTSVSAESFEGILVSLRGRPVVVNIWASWCGPCRVEAPLLQKASRHYGDRVAFLGVDARDSEGPAREFLRRHGITYPNVVDTGEEVTSLLGLRGFPTTYIFDRNGRVRASVVGGISEQTLAARVDEQLRA